MMSPYAGAADETLSRDHQKKSERGKSPLINFKNIKTCTKATRKVFQVLAATEVIDVQTMLAISRFKDEG